MTKLLPLRLSLQHIGEARLSGPGRCRQRAARVMLQTQIRSVSGNLVDVGMEIGGLNMHWDQLDDELRATPKFKPGMLRVRQDEAMAVWAKHGCLFCNDIVVSQNQEFVQYDRLESGPQCAQALRRQMALAMTLGLTKLPLFVMLLGNDDLTRRCEAQNAAHALCAIVHFRASTASGPVRIEAIDWLNTWNHDLERTNEVAMTLLSIVLSHVTAAALGNVSGRHVVSDVCQHPGDIMARMRLPLRGEYNLQEGELTGLCQSWDSYFIYKILAQGVRPAKLFRCLRRADQKRRRERVLNFTNSLWAAFERRFKK